MRMLAQSLCFCVFSTNLLGQELPDSVPQAALAMALSEEEPTSEYPGVRLGAKTERAAWNVDDHASSLAFANILRVASMDPNNTEIKLLNVDAAASIHHANCSGSVLRPGRGEGPFVDVQNQIVCETQSNQNPSGMIILDLSKEPLHRFGDTFSNFGVKVRGSIATRLYAAAAQILQESSDENYLLTESIASFGIDKTVGWRYHDYHVAWNSQGRPSERPSIFECGQDENFSVETHEAIPGTSSGTYCVFMYHRRDLN